MEQGKLLLNLNLNDIGNSTYNHAVLLDCTHELLWKRWTTLLAALLPTDSFFDFARGTDHSVLFTRNVPACLPTRSIAQLQSAPNKNE